MSVWVINCSPKEINTHNGPMFDINLNKIRVQEYQHGIKQFELHAEQAQGDKSHFNFSQIQAQTDRSIAGNNYTLTAKQAEFDIQQSGFRLSYDIIITDHEHQIKTQEAIFNPNNKTLTMPGIVAYQDTQITAVAEGLIIHLDTQSYQTKGPIQGQWDVFKANTTTQPIVMPH